MRKKKKTKESDSKGPTIDLRLTLPVGAELGQLPVDLKAVARARLKLTTHRKSNATQPSLVDGPPFPSRVFSWLTREVHPTSCSSSATQAPVPLSQSPLFPPDFFVTMRPSIIISLPATALTTGMGASQLS